MEPARCISPDVRLTVPLFFSTPTRRSRGRMTVELAGGGRTKVPACGGGSASCRR